MDPTASPRLRRALRAHAGAQATLDRTLAELHAAIVADLDGAPRGRQAELARLTGYSRERIRQLARAAGLNGGKP